MPIKSMKCASCKSEDVFFAIDLGNGHTCLYDNGNVESSYDSNIYKYENDDGEVSILDLLDNIPLSQSEWNKLGLSGKLHTDPNHVSCLGVSINGECRKCEDECVLVVKFEDGKKLGEKEVLIKLVNELRNPNLIITKALSSTAKISTGYLKTLIPQYVKEHFGNKALNTLTEEKNWKRISKSKNDGKILRIFEYKKNPEIKLYINSNESDTEIVGYNFQET